ISRIFSEFPRLLKYSRAGFVKLQGSTAKREFWILSITKAAYFAVFLGLPLIFSGFAWWLVIVGFLVMHITAGLFMSTVFQMAHLVELAVQPLPDEHGVIASEWMVHEL